MMLLPYITIPWECAQLYSAVMLLIWLTPILFLVRKSVMIAEYCRSCGDEMDEVDMIFSNHELARSWWRTFLAWICLTAMWMVV